MGRTLTPDRQYLALEAQQFRESGWTEKQIADTLRVPIQTISRWLNNENFTNANMGGKYSISHFTTYIIPTNIILYPCLYEDVGDKITHMEGACLEIPLVISLLNITHFDGGVLSKYKT